MNPISNRILGGVHVIHFWRRGLRSLDIFDYLYVKYFYNGTKVMKWRKYDRANFFITGSTNDMEYK